MTVALRRIHARAMHVEELWRHEPGPFVAALVGNPNAGKSALFNALTGARQKIANYPGVTVERKAGRLLLPRGEPVELVDLPGSYGLPPPAPTRK
jgi:ferrous iron transport protein B